MTNLAEYWTVLLFVRDVPRFTNNGDQSVTDNLTGLIWTIDANVRKSRDPYFGANFDGAGIPLGPVDGVGWSTALDYIKKLNKENYLGHNDWRLPNFNELKSLLNRQYENSSYDYQPTWLKAQGFLNVQGDAYWTSTPYFDNSGGSIWYISFYNGIATHAGDISPFYIWPVRSGPSPGAVSLPKTGNTACLNTMSGANKCSGDGQDGDLQIGIAWPAPRFTDNSLANSAEKTITDNLTGLIWSKDANLATTYKSWQEMFKYIKTLNSINFSGHNDWRLPNINELDSLVNRGVRNQVEWLTGKGFTNVQEYYWSSTFLQHDTTFWPVQMLSGNIGFVGGNTQNFVWPVRSVKLGSLGSLTLSVTKSGTGAGTVTSSIGEINCGSTCTASILSGTSVVLIAVPDSGSTFTGWSGACSGTGTCTVTMDSAKDVAATFSDTQNNVINGVCGSSNGGTFPTTPGINLCSAGTATTVAGTGPWSWTCQGTNGGTTASCSATKSQDTLSITITSSDKFNTIYRGGKGTVAFNFTGSATAEIIKAATIADSWVTIGTIKIGGNSGTMSFSVAANNGAARTGSIKIGNAVITITQDAPPCKIAAATAPTVPASGGDVTINVIVAPEFCTWSATAIKAGGETWLSNVLNISKTGSGNVTGKATKNTTGKARSTSVTIATGDGKSKKNVTVKQAAK